MAVQERRPVSLAEVINLIGEGEKSEKTRQFIKNFEVLPYEKAMELKAELEGLDLIKLKEEHIVKLIDFIPKDATELNKIVQEVTLDSEEVTKILDVTKKY